MTTTTAGITAARYRAPGWFTRSVFNRAVSWLTRRGVGVWGARILEVEGRVSGVTRSTPVNVLDVDGAGYLVAPRGETQWVRNLRASRRAVLRLGRVAEHVVAVEVVDAVEVAAVLRPYLRRWHFEVGAFFDGVGPDASDEELCSIAWKHPVFRLSPT